MKLTQDGDVLAENKILILYVLDKLGGPITNDGLYRLVLAIDEMNYFYFQQFLLDLLEKKFVISFEKDDKTMYQISDIGKATLDLTADMIPGILKLKADISFSGELKETAQEESITAEYTPKNENEYTVTCKINENNTCIFEISVFAGSREEAKRIVDNWKENANRIYPEILNSLNS